MSHTSSEEDNIWDVAAWGDDVHVVEPVGAAKEDVKQLLTKKLHAAPSAGTVSITFSYDGSLLAPSSAQGRVAISAWSSLNRHTRVSHLDFRRGEQKWQSKDVTIELPLHDEYTWVEKARNKQLAETAKTDEPEYELGSLRSDSNVWFEALVEEHSLMTNQAVMGRTGATYLNVADLVEISRSVDMKNAKLPMVLFGQMDEKTKQNVIKGYLTIKKVSFGKDTRKLHALAAQNALLNPEWQRFEINEANLPMLVAVNGTAVTKGIFDVVNEDNLQPRETRSPNNRIRMPWYQTHQPDEGLNRLPIHAFFLDTHALNPLPTDAAEDEQYLINVFGHAFKQRNMTLKYATKVMSAQLARRDATYDPEFTECVSNIARGLVQMSNTFPYQSDVRFLAHRVDRFMNASKAVEASKVDVESLDKAQRRGGGDCEDLAHYAYAHYQMLRRGKSLWRSPFLQTAQRVMELYDPCMMLGSVTSPALGNEHDVDKTASHLADAEHHERVLLRTAGEPDEHLTRSETTRVVHKHTVRNSEADLAKPVGGHSWMELIPKHKMLEFVSRIVPDTQNATHSAIASAAGFENCPWKFYVPHMLLEGTGRINPLLMPAAYYAAPTQKREELRKQELTHLRTFHNLISQSSLLHGLQSEAQSQTTVNTPYERLTEFYVQSTQTFTDSYLDKTGVVAFNWFQLQPDAPVHEQEVDPLFEKQDALNLRNISNAQSKFVSSSGKKPRNALEAFHNGGSGASETTAIGKLVGCEQVRSLDASKLSIGVDLEQRLLDRPMAPNVGLLPVGGLSRLEAKVLATQMRQVYPEDRPGTQLSMFATEKPAAFVRVSDDNDDESSSNAMARLTQNPKLVNAQRSYIEYIEQNMKRVFSDRPWLTRKQAKQQNLTLHTFFFAPQDMTSEKAPRVFVQEVQELRAKRMVHTARFYVREPTQNYRTGVLQLLCPEPSN